MKNNEFSSGNPSFSKRLGQLGRAATLALSLNATNADAIESHSVEDSTRSTNISEQIDSGFVEDRLRSLENLNYNQKANIVREWFTPGSETSLENRKAEEVADIIRELNSDHAISSMVAEEWIYSFEWWRDAEDGENLARRILGSLSVDKDLAVFIFERAFQEVLIHYSHESWPRIVFETAVQNDPEQYFLRFQDFQEIFPFHDSNELLNGIVRQFPDLAYKALIKYDGNFENVISTIRAASPGANPALAVKLLHEKGNQLPDDIREYLAVIEKRAPIEVAVIGHNIDPDYGKLRGDFGAVKASTIDQKILYPLVGDTDFETLWHEIVHSEKYSSEELSVLYTYSEQNDYVNPVELGNVAMFVSRNMFNKGVHDFNDEMVAEEVLRIIEARDRVGEKMLLDGDIVFVAHGEKWEIGSGEDGGGVYRFGPPELLKAIAENMPKDKQLDFFRPDNDGNIDFESATESKRLSLQSIAQNVKGNELAWFSGHGAEGAFYLSDGVIENTIEGTGAVNETDTTVKITYQELADALEERYSKIRENGDDGLNISLVFSACYMNDFILRLAEELKIRNIPMPDLIASMSEHGQKGYTEYNNPYGNPFEELLATEPRLKDVIERQLEKTNSNPSFFVPRQENNKILMQIGGLDSGAPISSLA